MPRTTLALTSFVSGELGAKLDGRTDFAKYSTGAKTLENFLVHPQGSAARRVGTQFVAEVKNSAAKTRLIPFEFSTVQTYVLEFGNQYMRVYKDKGQVLSKKNVGDWSVTARCCCTTFGFLPIGFEKRRRCLIRDKRSGSIKKHFW